MEYLLHLLVHISQKLRVVLRPAVTRFVMVHFQISTEIIMGYILTNLCKIEMHYHHNVILY